MGLLPQQRWSCRMANLLRSPSAAAGFSVYWLHCPQQRLALVGLSLATAWPQVHQLQGNWFDKLRPAHQLLPASPEGKGEPSDHGNRRKTKGPITTAATANQKPPTKIKIPKNMMRDASWPAHSTNSTREGTGVAIRNTNLRTSMQSGNTFDDAIASPSGIVRSAGWSSHRRTSGSPIP